MRDLYPTRRVSPRELAERFGVSSSGIRAAIADGRLPADRVGSRWQVSESDADAFAVAPRDATPALHVRHGAEDGLVLHVSHDGTYEREERSGGVSVARVSGWCRAAVLTTHKAKGTTRLFEIEADRGQMNEVRLGELYVRGGFATVSAENNARRARERWRKLRAASQG